MLETYFSKILIPPQHCSREIVQGMPILCTHSLSHTLSIVSVHLARKPSGNMPAHASINQSMTVTHEVFPRCSTFAGGSVRVRRRMTVNIDVPRGHYVWNVHIAVTQKQSTFTGPHRMSAADKAGIARR